MNAPAYLPEIAASYERRENKRLEAIYLRGVIAAAQADLQRAERELDPEFGEIDCNAAIEAMDTAGKRLSGEAL